MITDKNQKAIATGLPIFCAVLALALTGYEYRNLLTERENNKVGQQRLRLLDETLTAKANRLNIKVPAVLMTQEEDTRFLEDLKKAAQDAGVAIVRWSSAAKPADNGAAKPPALKGIMPEHSDLEVYGPYESVRAFVIRLEAWPRMLSMNNVSWHRGGKEGTRLSMLLIRYVQEPAAGPAGAANPAPTATGGTQ